MTKERKEKEVIEEMLNPIRTPNYSLILSLAQKKELCEDEKKGERVVIVINLDSRGH